VEGVGEGFSGVCQTMAFPTRYEDAKYQRTHWCFLVIPRGNEV
jgi:hypothetical protein